MATTVTAQDLIRPSAPAEAVLRRPTRSLWSDAWRQFRRHRLAMFGVFTFSLLLVATLVGPLVYRTPADTIDYGSGLLGPSLQHPFGTDDLGRDLLARALLGGRVSMAVGMVAGLMANHILPNTLSSVIVAATVGVGAAIITESALSFLGLGFPPDMPTWGRLLYDAQNFLDLAPHWAIFPGLLIFLTVLSINYIGDGLRDALDPRKTQ